MKVIFCDLFLSTFTYTIEHVSEHLNTMEEIMNRWMRENHGHPVRLKPLRCKIELPGVINDCDPESKTWPTRELLLQEQNATSDTLTTNRTTDNDELVRISGVILVPTDDHSLKFKLLYIYYARYDGHSGLNSTPDRLSGKLRLKI